MPPAKILLMAAAGYPAHRLAAQIGRQIFDGTRRDVRAGLQGWRARRTGDESGGAELTDFDPLDPEVIRDPYPSYRHLLEGAPLQFSRRRRVWILTPYEDVRAALQAHSLLSSGEGVMYLRRAMPMLLTMDRPQHTRLRRVAARHFTHEALALRRARIEAIAAGAVERAADAGQVEAVSELAVPVPVDVIAELLGVPTSDRDRFRNWSDRVVVGFNLAPGKLLQATASVMPAIFGLHGYFYRVFDARRASPGDDLISHLQRSSEEGQMTADELFWFTFLLLIAGTETTSNLLGTLLLTLAKQPRAFERLRQEPDLIPAAVEESLRLHSPVQAFYRTALRPYEVGQATVPAGGRILLMFAAANRDARKYPDPETYVLERNPTDHLAFGSGIHFCLGAHLARLEAAAVLRRLTERVASLELAGQPAWTRNPALRGIERLPLRLKAA